MSEERRLFRGQLIAAGETRTMTGERGGYVVTAEAIREAIDQGLFKGLACFVDHSATGPSVRQLVGVWRQVRWDDAAGAAVGQLLAYETDGTRPVLDMLDQWLGERAAAPDIGVSLVFYPRLAADGRTVRAIVMVESADLVMFPASAGSRIMERVAPDEGAPAPERLSVRAPGLPERLGDPSHSLLLNTQHPSGSPATPAPSGLTVAFSRPAAGPGASSFHSHPATRPAGRGVFAPGHIQPPQEKRQMNQETIDKDLPRVALALGDMPDDPPAAAQPAPAEWLDALKTAAVEAVLRASGLPAPMQQRLGEGRYESAGDVYAAVERARGELAALNEAGVVQLGGTRPASLRLRDPLDEARGLMGFFFGAAGATTPPANMRSFGDLYVALTGDVHFRGVFDGDRVLFGSATTATLPNLAVDAMNRVVVEQFQALVHYRWYERIVAVTPNDGRLHDMKWITLGGAGNLPSVGEGAAYTELSLGDVKETAPFVKRGGYVGITREMIKNSDVMQLQAIPRALATAAIRSRSAAVSALFTANAGAGPTLAQDSKALFHTDHSNLGTAALDATNWRLARAECFRHAEVAGGKPLAVFPRYVLVPSDLYDTALALFGYGEGMPASYTPEAQDRGFADPRPIPLVVPDWSDANDWAYIVDPAVYPVIQMSYSQAPGGREHPAPELFAVASENSGLLFTNDTLPIKVRDEFALGVNGPRGIGKRNVAN